MKIKLNTDLKKKKKGDIVDLSLLKGLDLTYWNNRLKDSKIDNCVTVLEEKKDEPRTDFYSEKSKKKGGK